MRELKELIGAMGIRVRAVLREERMPYARLGLGDPKWSDAELIDFILAHPILINRPIVVRPKGVKTLPAVGDGVRDLAGRRQVQGGRRGRRRAWAKPRRS